MENIYGKNPIRVYACRMPLQAGSGRTFAAPENTGAKAPAGCTRSSFSAKQMRTEEEKAKEKILAAAGTDYGFPQAPVLVHLDCGKPFLSGVSGLSVSVSHSGVWCVMAFSNKTVGVDIQETRKVTPALLRRFPAIPGNKSADFFRRWTLAESYMKFTGRGLAEGLETIRIRGERNTGETASSSTPETPKHPAYTVTGRIDRYRITSEKGSPAAFGFAVPFPDDEYRLAVVTEKADCHISLQILSH